MIEISLLILTKFSNGYCGTPYLTWKDFEEGSWVKYKISGLFIKEGKEDAYYLKLTCIEKNNREIKIKRELFDKDENVLSMSKEIIFIDKLERVNVQEGETNEFSVGEKKYNYSKEINNYKKENVEVSETFFICEEIPTGYLKHICRVINNVENKKLTEEHTLDKLEEEIEVGYRKYKCCVYKYSSKVEIQDKTIFVAEGKIFMNRDIPGFVVKYEINYKDTNGVETKEEMEIIGYELKK